MISCIAIDDEPIALDVIKSHASKVSFLNLQATFLSPVEAIRFTKQEPVDLIFLDINMPDISGIEFTRLLDNRAGIIFTTAHTDYAIQAFDLSAIDYLLKPISLNRFLTACLRAQEHLTSHPSNEEKKSIFIKDGYQWIKINLDDLLYVEASDNYLIFKEPKRKTISRMTLKEAEERLPATIFIRVHKSFLINLSNVEKIDSNQVTISGRSIPVSPTYRKDLIDRIK